MFSQFHDQEIEAFLDRLNTQLKPMPKEDRAELHQELRQHLDALAAAHRELGASPEEAVEAALRQFGDPSSVGRRLMKEWRLGMSRTARVNRTTVLGVAVLESLAVFWYFWAHLGSSLDAGQLWAFLLAPPVLAGVWAGWASPRTFLKDLACGFLAPAGLLLLAAVRDLAFFHQASLSWQGLGLLQREAMSFSFAWGLWVILGCLCASLVCRLRRSVDTLSPTA